MRYYLIIRSNTSNNFPKYGFYRLSIVLNGSITDLKIEQSQFFLPDFLLEIQVMKNYQQVKNGLTEAYVADFFGCNIPYL